MLSPELVLRHIEGSPRRRATLKQLLRELKVRGQERPALRAILTELVGVRRLSERRHVFEAPAPPAKPPAPRVPSGARRPPPHPSPRLSPRPSSQGDLTGIIQLHRDGYAFVAPDPPRPDLAADVFIPPPAVNGAMPGDLVTVKLVRRRGGPGGLRLEGAVVSIPRRSRSTLVGIFHLDPHGDYVQPLDDRLRDRVLIPPDAALPALAPAKDRVLGEPAAHALDAARLHSRSQLDGLVVDIEITRFPSTGIAPRGRVIEVLGHRDDFGVDVEIVIRKHGLLHRFPAAALEEAQALPTAVPAADCAGRRDFRGLPIVTIDGESARDFDDAVLVTRRADGGFELQVHIADVAAYVLPGSAIDAEAQRRGTSVYFPDRAVPMLPTELSTGLCSLRPGEDRLTLSCLMQIDRRGEIAAYELTPGVIRSAARMTYTQVNAVLERDPGARAQFAELAAGFEVMAELQAALQAKRQRRGSIDFDLPEPEIAFDEFGLMRSIVKSERNIAHRLIEEFMLAAAETVARHLQAAGWASVYRIHEPPDLKKVAEFEQIAATFGYSLGVPLPIQTLRVRGGPRGRERAVDVPQPGKFSITPRHYQKLTARIAGTPEERLLSFLMLRSLKQARYSANNQGHFALATDCYTHFTSPIRRYPDLLLHRILKAQLAGEQPPAELAAPEAIEPLCGGASLNERRADEAERELMDWKKVRFMERRLGEVFPALIIHVTRQGFYVELTDMFIEGLVPADSLDDDEYRFLSATQEWVGERGKRRYKLGSRLEVIVDRIDPVRQQIHFAPAPKLTNNTEPFSIHLSGRRRPRHRLG